MKGEGVPVFVREVPLSAVSQELESAWSATDEESRRSRGEGMLRLRELNYVVCARTEAEAEVARATVGRLMGERPGRVVVLVDTAGVPGGDPAACRLQSTSASIATRCLLDGGSGQRVCSEEVVVVASGEEARAARTAVFGLLVPDLPVLGRWIGSFSADDETLLWLGEAADHLVVDTGAGPADVGGPVPGRRDALADAIETMRDMRVLLDAPMRARVHDLSWLRIEPWRLMMAELFDDPSRRRLIPDIGRLSVRHAGASGQAVLYAAWFDSRLGGVGSVSVDIQEESRGGEVGLVQVEVWDRSDRDTPQLSLSRRPHSRVISARVTGEHGRGQEVTIKTLETPSDEEWLLLRRALESTRPDPVFRQAVGLVGAASSA